MNARTLLLEWRRMEDHHQKITTLFKRLETDAKNATETVSRWKALALLDPRNLTPFQYWGAAHAQKAVARLLQKEDEWIAVVGVLEGHLWTIRKAVDALPEPHRTLLTLRFRDGLPRRSIRRIRGMPAHRMQEAIEDSIQYLEDELAKTREASPSALVH